MTRISRRKFIKTTGVGALAASSGGLAGILATGRAPAYAQQTTVHWLRWNDFVPACDQLLRQKLMPEAEKALGIKVKLETVNGNDLQPRITSASSRAPAPTCIMLFNNHPHLYQASLVDCQRCRRARSRKDAGRLLQAAHRQLLVGRQVSSRMPMAIIGAHERLSQIVVRRSRAQRVPEDLGPVSRRRQEAEGQGLSDRPVARPVVRRPADLRLSAAVVVRRRRGRRQGQGRHQLQGDGRGGQVDGRRLEGLASTRAASPGTTPPTTARSSPAPSLRPSTALRSTSSRSRKPEQYKPRRGKPLKDDILHAPLPGGPAGQFGFHTYAVARGAELFEEHRTPRRIS